jgi:hypothetical protein
MTAIMDRISFEINDIEYPPDFEVWREMFKSCASFRLFLPVIMMD